MSDVPPTAVASKLTPFGTLIGVLFRPRATFAAMRDAERGYWWVVLVLGIISLVLVTVAVVPIEAKLTQDVLAAQQEGVQLSAEEQAQMEQTQAIFSSQAMLGALGIVGGIVTMLIGFGARSGLLFLFGLAFGARVEFKQVWRMGVWTMLPGVVRNIASAIAVFVTGELPAAGLSAIYVSNTEVAEASAALVAILGKIDIYIFWSLVLVGMGMVATSKMSKVKASVTAIFTWLLGLGWVAAWAVIGQQIGRAFGGG
ncbi:MAG: YIP1 family protein [Anaerolineae bacterium]|nr:YIP1 family protein [Anaerolineae bacterium]